jgi:hypothetical protein
MIMNQRLVSQLSQCGDECNALLAKHGFIKHLSKNYKKFQKNSYKKVDQ